VPAHPKAITAMATGNKGFLAFMGLGGHWPPAFGAMAQTEHLPICKRSYHLCLYLEQAVRGFSRCPEYALGGGSARGRPPL
jgi:hypothetical protein